MPVVPFSAPPEEKQDDSLKPSPVHFAMAMAELQAEYSKLPADKQPADIMDDGKPRVR